ADSCEWRMGVGMADAGLGGDGQADHQRRRGDAQHRGDPKAYPRGHRDLLDRLHPVVWDHRWFGAAATTDGHASRRGGPPARPGTRNFWRVLGHFTWRGKPCLHERAETVVYDTRARGSGWSARRRPRCG